jgi:hypothetical protein
MSTTNSSSNQVFANRGAVGEKTEIAVCIDTAYDEDEVDGKVLSGSVMGERLKTIFSAVKLDVRNVLKVAIVRRDSSLLDYEQEYEAYAKRELQMHAPQVVVCMGWKSLACVLGASKVGAGSRNEEANQKWFHSMERDNYVGMGTFWTSRFWVVPMRAPHEIRMDVPKEYDAWKRKMLLVKSKLASEPPIQLEMFQSPFPRTAYTSDLGTRWKSAQTERPVAADTMRFIPLYVQYNASSDQMVVHGSLASQNGTLAIILDEFMYVCYVGPFVDVSALNLYGMLESAKLDVFKKCANLSHIDKASLKIEAVRGAVDVLAGGREVDAIKLSCTSWNLVERIGKALSGFATQHSMEGVLRVARTNPESQVGAVMMPFMRQVCVVANRGLRDTYAEKVVKNASISMRASLRDFKLEPDASAVDVATMYRAIHLYVVYGGYVRATDSSLDGFASFQVYAVGMDAECHVVGMNGVTNELELLCKVFHRVREIKPMMIVGYQATRDLYLMFGRLRYLHDLHASSMGEELIKYARMALYSTSVWVSADFTDSSSRPLIKEQKIYQQAYPTVMKGSDDNFLVYAMVPILDVKMMEARFGNAYDGRACFHSIASLSPEVAYRWMHDKTFESMKAVITQCLKSTYTLVAYLNSKGYLKLMNNLCDCLRHQYSLRNILTTPAVELAESCVYNSSAYMVFGTAHAFKAGMFNMLPRSSEFAHSKFPLSELEARMVGKEGAGRVPTFTERAFSAGAGKYPKEGYVLEDTTKKLVVYEAEHFFVKVVALLKKSPEGRGQYANRIQRLVDNALSAPKEDVVFTARYLLMLLGYALQVGYGEEFGQALVDDVTTWMEDSMSRAGAQKYIGWDMFGRVIVEQREQDGVLDAYNYGMVKFVCKHVLTGANRSVVWGTSGMYGNGKVWCSESNMIERQLLSVYCCCGPQEALVEYTKMRAECIEKYGLILWMRLELPACARKTDYGTIGHVAKSGGYTVGDMVPYCIDERGLVVSAEFVSMGAGPKKSVYAERWIDYATESLRGVLKIAAPATPTRLLTLSSSGKKRLAASSEIERVPMTKCLRCNFLTDAVYCDNCVARASTKEKREMCSAHQAIIQSCSADIEEIVSSVCTPCSGWKKVENSCSNYVCPQYAKKKKLSAEKSNHERAIRYLQSHHVLATTTTSSTGSSGESEKKKTRTTLSTYLESTRKTKSKTKPKTK